MKPLFSPKFTPRKPSVKLLAKLKEDINNNNPFHNRAEKKSIIKYLIALNIRLIINKLKLFNSNKKEKYPLKRNDSLIKNKFKNKVLGAANSYSHLSFNRGQILRSTILKSGYFNILKKLDEFWESIATEYLLKA